MKRISYSVAIVMQQATFQGMEYTTDIDILRRACLSFRKIFLEHGNVCPFVECTTIASTCMRVFRKNFLRKEEEIGIIPTGGYRMNDNQSRKLSRTMIEGMLVDGYYECENVGETQCHILQFHGCFFHGCPICYRIYRDEKIGQNSKDTLDARYERTIATIWRLRLRCGYIVTEKWEYVLLTRFHPVLPYHIRGKLLFSLCRTRCETFSQSACARDESSEHEIWQYQCTKGLFAGYINIFLQLKQKARGWPSQCEGDEITKERYLPKVTSRSNVVKKIGLPNTKRLCVASLQNVVIERIKESCWCSEANFCLILSDLYYRPYYH
ncbi:hypothetical protein ALC57_18550 [Trachymyrmex cornetzi]|uniref:Uncharacterized protein n=1 Tax=Trachymyrmex cornetzi TaxID=471704 RepID=A0A151IRM2_9HYME|nr:hypothetical protein ALC57_18550 [Trachymyrmex cornetzi]